MADVFKPKSDEEIENIIDNMNTEQLFAYGLSLKNKELIKLGIERSDSNVYAYDYDLPHLNKSNPLNLHHFWEVIGIDENRYVLIRRITTGEEDSYSISFFAQRFTPIHKGDTKLQETKDDLDKIMKTLNG